MGKSNMLAATLVLVVATTACQPPAQEPAGLSEEDVAAITSASQAWAEAFKADDDAAVIAFATEDAVTMPPNTPAFQGRPASEEYLASFTVTDFSVTRLEIDGRGDLAFERSAYVVSFVPEGQTESSAYPGKYLNIWRKQADGSWLMAINIWNSDQPLPEQSGESGT